MNSSQIFQLNGTQILTVMKMVQAQIDLDEALGIISQFNHPAPQGVELPESTLWTARYTQTSNTVLLNHLQETADEETLRAYMGTYLAVMEEAEEKKTTS